MALEQSRRGLASDLESPAATPAPWLCSALLPDQRTPCARRLPADSTSRFCTPHAREYHARHAEYKGLSATASASKRKVEAMLKPYFGASVPHGDGSSALSLRPAADADAVAVNRLGALGSGAVDAVVECAASWRYAVALEISAHETHHDRFFPMGGASL